LTDIVTGQITVESQTFNSGEVAVDLHDGALCLVFSGELCPENTRDLTEFLEKAMGYAVTKNLKIIFDFRKLRFLNSTSLHGFIMIACRLSQATIESEIIYDASNRSQKIAFFSLKFAVRNYKSVVIRET